jgi:hypothetical protein
VLILHLIQQEKKSYAEVAKMYGRNESSIREGGGGGGGNRLFFLK